ncbi:MAG TPA: class I adenylate-forming enzyme family protein [Lacunisphaera sp.]|jgi:acyl-coenzyme A synthetase/AMP-(fatty) acid ligase
MNDNSLLSAWEKTVRRRGDHRAIIEAANGQGVTFRELEMRANAWVSRHASGAGRLSRRTVVAAMPNGIAWFVTFLGLLKSGAIVVPLDAAEPPAAQRRIAESLRAGFLWEGEKIVPLPGAARTNRADLCLVKLTSGTTGTPRAIHFTAKQLLADARQVTSTMGITARDLNYALIPFGHSYGFGNLTIPLLAHGVPLVCGTSALPHSIAADFARWNPTVFPGVPAMWRALAASDITLKNLRLGISAGAPLMPETAREFAARFGVRLHNFYGSSETGGIAYDRSGRPTLNGGVGRAMRGVTLESLRHSRLKVASAAVFTHRNPRRQKGIGAWIMADAVAMNSAGELTLQGRRGQTVKVAGRRVSLSEVAQRLRAIAGVQEVWVGTTTGNEPVLSAVVATKLTATELRTALHADTAAWKIPKKWLTLSALPTTARGKTDTRALQALIG